MNNYICDYPGGNTGIVLFSDNNGIAITGLHVDRETNKTYIVVSTWGKKGYIDLNELCSLDSFGAVYFSEV